MTNTTNNKKNTTTTTTTAMEQGHNITGKISGHGYTLQTVTIKQLSTMLQHLPQAQNVRGSVWTPAVSDELVKDVARGAYVPPIVISGAGDVKTIEDGQQRSRALVKALELGLISGDCKVLVAIDTVRTSEECFRVMNLGVPVSKALVSAMSYTPATRSAVLTLAEKPILSNAKWTATQVTKTMRASFAALALAIVAGWDCPESSDNKVNAWLKSNDGEIAAEDIAAAGAILDSMGEYVDGLNATIKERGKKQSKAEVKVLGELRKKNVWSAVIGAVVNGANVVDVLDVIRRTDAHTVPVKLFNAYDKQGNGKGKGYTKAWADCFGAGSSGDNYSYNERVRILGYLATWIKDNDKPADETEVDPAAVAMENTTVNAAADMVLAGLLGDTE